MRPEVLADSIARAIIDTADNFAVLISDMQEIIYNKLLIQLKNLDIDADGYIRQIGANREVLAKAEDVVSEYLPGTKLNAAASEALSVIPTIDSLNNEYFSSISDSFKENRIFIRRLQQQTIQSIESNILGDGLNAQVKMPLVNILNRNVNAGGQFHGFLQEVRTYVEGTESLDGRLLSYSRGFLRDALFQYSRGFQEAMTNDLKLEFYLYAGGLQDTSREFCVERAGNYYHRKEIESWADLTWRGKNPLTTSSSIFVFVAGYNCSHEMVPVHILIVPKDVIDRNIENGNYKPS
jgi:hypothetical protein